MDPDNESGLQAVGTMGWPTTTLSLRPRIALGQLLDMIQLDAVFAWTI